jgi:D-alanyl-D-alanine carboxypeptidase (penicillin-binding protein 5/6)
MDFDTSAVLLEKAADDRMPPSSMSKLMTMYVVFELLKNGRLRMDQELPVSERAWRMGGSKMFVEIGNSISVENLARGVIVQSGNDACVVLAEGISGSEQQFAELMNETARRIGLTGSNFRNATGWPDPEHRMTSRDLAQLARRIIRDFPDTTACTTSAASAGTTSRRRTATRR